MIENAPGIYNAPSVYNQGGGGGKWYNGTTIINGHNYRTISNGKVEWLAQNLNEAFAGITVTDTWTSYTSGNNHAYRFKMAAANYAQEDLENILGLFYRQGCRQYITDNLTDGWRIPSFSDWDKLFSACDNTRDLVSTISKTYSGYTGSDSTGFSVIGADRNGFNTIASFIVTNSSNGYMCTQTIRSDGHCLRHNENGNIWYDVGACRLVRNL